MKRQPLKQTLKALFFKVSIFTYFDTVLAAVCHKNKKLEKFIPPPKFYKQSSVRTITRDGVVFRIRPADFMQWVLLAGEKDRSMEALDIYLQQGIKGPEVTVLDIGANCGHFSLRCARHLKERNITGKVYGFEPNPNIMKSLKDNVSLNPKLDGSIRLFPNAVGDKPGFLEISVPLRNTGAGSLSHNYEHEPHENFTVETLTVDHFLEKENVANVDFLKIDVESFEPFVLMGAEKCFDKFNPGVYIEFTNIKNDERGIKNDYVYNFFAKRGYKIYVDTSEGFKPVDRFSELDAYGHCNFMAIRFALKQ